MCCASVAIIGGHFPINSVHEGLRFFYQQGGAAEAVLEQTVQLYNVPDADMDGGNLVAELSAWQAHNYPEDQAQVIAEFLDAHSALLGSIATPLQHTGTSGWIEVTTSGAVPPGVRQARIKLRALRGAAPGAPQAPMGLLQRDLEPSLAEHPGVVPLVPRGPTNDIAGPAIGATLST